MNTLVPNYYKDFKCIADKCRHSCCIGWEIDIDCDTLEFYKGLKTPLGEKIMANISDEGEAHFILGEGERCPFLEKSGLCEIIKNMGDEATCDICREHPRFRTFYENFTETGLGLCCEEAARLILNFKEPFGLYLLEGDGEIELSEDEAEILSMRNDVISVLTNRERPLSERFEKLSEMLGFSFDGILPDGLLPMYISLERLDESWTECLRSIWEYKGKVSFIDEEEFSIPFEQLSVYFIYRHFSNADRKSREKEICAFSVFSCLIIGAMAEEKKKRTGNLTVSDIEELSRMYSSEIEYSEENTEKLLEFFEERI